MIERYRKIQQEKAAGEREEGFTLIELLIVIVVLGILAAIVIFSLTGVTGTSAVAACNTDAKTVETAVAAWEAQNPGTLLTAQSNGTNTLVPSYLHTWPNSNPNLYSITVSAQVSTAGVITGGAVTVTPQPNATPPGSPVAFDTESGSTLTLGGCGAA
jgi:general secretion pathway protein G